MRATRSLCSWRHWPLLALAVLLVACTPYYQVGQGGYYAGESNFYAGGSNFAFSINSGLGVYQAAGYPGFLYCTNVYCYRWAGYGWYYAPWGGGPWMPAPANYLLPPPLIYGPPPPLVVVYRPYFVWWRGDIGPWYAIHHPIWWRQNRVYITHYTVWRTHVIRTYGPHVSSVVWTRPRVLGMRPRFLPKSHPDIHWAQRQWARKRPVFYGRAPIGTAYRQHPQFGRARPMRQPMRRFGGPAGLRGPRGTGFPQGGMGNRMHPVPNRGYGYPQGRAGQPFRPVGPGIRGPGRVYGRPTAPGMRPQMYHPAPLRRLPQRGVGPRRCRNPRHCF